MSRSFKKTPIGGDKKSNKNFANQRVRRFLKGQYVDLLQRSNYKKYYPQYDICDYISYCTFEEYCAFREKLGYDISDRRKMYKEWVKWYKRK